MIVIQEPPVQFQQNAMCNQTVSLTTCCCCNQGESSLSVKFDKNIFYSNEQALADVLVNNSKSKLRISEVEF